MRDLQSMNCSKRRPRWSSIAMSVITTAAAFLISCASPEPTIVGGGRSVSLEPDEGLLVVQITTDVAVKEVFISGGSVAKDLPPGDHLWLVRLPAGRYSWSRIDLGPGFGWDGRIGPRNSSVGKDAEYEFDVQAGHLNYPGELILRTNRIGRSSGLGIEIRNRNHSAMAVRRLRKRYSLVIEAFPLRYAGMSGDEFLEYFSKTRRTSK